MGLQTFVESVPTSSIGQLANENPSLGFIDSAVKTLGNFVEASQKSSEDAKEVANTRSTAVDEIHAEQIEREPALDEAVSFGSLTAEQSQNFGQDLQASLAALSQAESKGMSNSVRASLQRSLLWQNSVMKSPDRLGDISNAFGIDHKKSGSGSLAEQTRAEEKARLASLKTKADAVRGVQAEYGVISNLSDQDTVDNWSGSDIAQLNSRNSQLKQRALASDDSNTLNKRYTRQSLGASMADDTLDLWKLVGASLESGTFAEDGTVQKGAQWMARKESELHQLYPRQPETVSAHMSTLRGQMSDYVNSQTSQQAIAAAKFRNENLLPLELARNQLGITDLSNRIDLHDVVAAGKIADASRKNAEAILATIEAKRVAAEGLGDNARDQQARANLTDDYNTRIAVLLSSGKNGTNAALEFMNPGFGDTQDQIEKLQSFISIAMLDPNVLDDPARGLDAANGINAYLTGTDSAGNPYLSSGDRATLQRSILDLGVQSPEFRELVSKSPQFQVLASSAIPALRTKVATSLKGLVDSIIGTSVSTVGVKGAVNPYTNISRGLGEFARFSPASASEGVLRLELLPGIDAAIGKNVADKLREKLPNYNNQLAVRHNGDLKFLAAVTTKDGDMSDALALMMRSSEGVSLTSLGQERTAPPPDATSIDSIANKIFDIPRSQSERLGEGIGEAIKDLKAKYESTDSEEAKEAIVRTVIINGLLGGNK